MWLPTNIINSSTEYSLEDGLPWQECFDGVDNDCDGLKDCADPGCKGVRNPDTGVKCCQNSSDCPSYNSTNHLKMYCDTDEHICKTIGRCGKMMNVKMDGAVIRLWGERELVNKKARLSPTVENHTFVIHQKDLLVLRMKTLILKLAKN